MASRPQYWDFESQHRRYGINGKTPVYSPIRISGIDCEFADRSNDGIMTFTDDQIRELSNIINRKLYE